MVISEYPSLQPKIRVPPETTKINTENFVEFITEFLMKVDSVLGLRIPLLHTKPQKEDKDFERKTCDILSAGGGREKLRKIFKKLKRAQILYDLAESNLKVYLLSCAGTSDILRRKIMQYKGDIYNLLLDLQKDYDKTSSSNAIDAERKLFELKYDNSTTNEEFIEKLEAGLTTVENAGGSISLDKLAQILLNAAKESERYKVPVLSFLTSFQREGTMPTWPETKQYVLNLDRTTKPVEVMDKIMFTDTKRPSHQPKNRFCKKCKTRHPEGQHSGFSDRKATAELVAAAVEILDKKRKFNVKTFKGNCYFCNKPGHTQKNCFSNPANKERRTQPYDRAALTRSEDSNASDYYEALERSTKGRYAYVLREYAHAIFETDTDKRFMMLYDTAATKIFVRYSWHRFKDDRAISTKVSTAGSGTLTTIREGLIGTVPAYGMSDELQIQLGGGQAFAKLGYEVKINEEGATLTHRTRSDILPYFVPWTDGLLVMNMKKIPFFMIRTKDQVDSNNEA